VHVAARVAALAVRVAPEANAWCDADGTVTECAHVDLELSSLGRTVVVRRADGRGAAEFAQALEAGAADALSAEEALARPATVAVEDLSRTGVVSFAPFVRPPAVCTFGIGAPTRSVAVSAAGVPVVRETIAVSLSHDARAVDDAAAARVAAEFQAIFERGLL
jgi:pyruvate/2-oxoglutarate dehydrogenase complex dihydrolipoamide acyltransferase (E2) component